MEIKGSLKARGIEEERQRMKQIAADQILNADLGALLSMST